MIIILANNTSFGYTGSLLTTNKKNMQAQPLNNSPTPPRHYSAIEAALLRQLVLPWGKDGKREPAIHIVATADGYQKIYHAIASSMEQNGAVKQSIAEQIKQFMPELSDHVIAQSAESYVLNRQDEAHKIVEGLAPDGYLVQQACALSESIRTGAVTQQAAWDALTSQTSLPDTATQALNQNHLNTTVAKKLERMWDYAQTPLPLTSPRHAAVHAAAFAAGHVPMHQALAAAFAPNGKASQAIAQEITRQNPLFSAQAAQITADGYCGFWQAMAQMDVTLLQPNQPMIAEPSRSTQAPLAQTIANTADHQGRQTAAPQIALAPR